MEAIKTIALMAGSAYLALEINEAIKFVKTVFAPLMNVLGA